MPDPAEFDIENYKIGEFCIDHKGYDPDIACRKCGWFGVASLFLNDRNERSNLPWKAL